MSEKLKETRLVINEDLVKEICHGVKLTLTSIIGVEPQPGTHRVGENYDIQGDVSGIMAVMQETLNGTFVVTFPKETILAMLARLYKRKFKEIDGSVRSGVGELTNMIYGVLKSSLNRNGYALKMVLPSVVLGEHHTVVTYGGGPVLTVPFQSPDGVFSVSLIVAPAMSQREAA